MAVTNGNLGAGCLIRSQLWPIYKKGRLCRRCPQLCLATCRLDCADAQDALRRCATVETFSTYVSIDSLPGMSAPVRVPETPSSLIRRQPILAARRLPRERRRARRRELPLDDQWSDTFARTLQSQHARIREFLESRSDRWRQIVARCERQIEQLQSELAELTAANHDLRDQAASSIRHEPRQESPESSQGYLSALEEIDELKARNSELQRQLREASSAPRRSSQPALPADTGSDWESQKRRLLAELESDDANEAQGGGGSQAENRRTEQPENRRTEIDEIIARTDRMIAEKDREIAEKNREIEELKHLLDNQTGSLGGLAVGAGGAGRSVQPGRHHPRGAAAAPAGPRGTPREAPTGRD